jgi:endonuclease/exonuclease/phosphatase (EEP) superfamily protein YafD
LFSFVRFSCFLSLALFAACGCAPPVRQFEVPSGPSFALLTYNVNWGGPGAEQAVGVIEKADADIVCLQETNPAWERLLRSRLAARYPHMRFHHSPGAGGSAVFSKRPAEEIFYGIPRAGWFPCSIVRADTPVGPVQVAVVHLRPPLNPGGGFSLGAYFGTKTTRMEEIREIHGHIDPGLPVLFAGDFNEDEGGRAESFLLERGFTDALYEFDRDSITWHWETDKWYLGTLTDRFDHVVYMKPLHCLQARVITAGASDHYPVFALFEVRPDAPH